MSAHFVKKSLFICVLLIHVKLIAYGQLMNDTLAFWEPATTLNKARLKTGIATAAVGYTTFSYGLYNTWYKQFETEPFHLFNDWGEWEHMDKIGHLYTAYFQSGFVYNAGRWTGLEEKKAIWIAVMTGTLFQSTIEVMDGFSSEWGFSLSDMAANTVGIAAFGLQQGYWGEQRIMFKVSSWPKSYSISHFSSEDGLISTNLDTRASELFGDSFLERYLKDYNAQTLWASVNVHSFLSEDTKWPKWLNIAAGYSGENMFGGFENKWTTDGSEFVLGAEHERYVQFIITPDIDFTRINPKSHFLRFVLGGLNVFKLPMPGISLNSRGELNFHFIYKH